MFQMSTYLGSDACLSRRDSEGKECITVMGAVALFLLNYFSRFS